MNSDAQPASSKPTQEIQPPRVDNSTPLDQWRGLALVCVLIAHGFCFKGHVEGLGRVGVNLFFFISGVLVFRSLVKPRETSLALAMHFWSRRVRRLYPALLTYVLAMIPVVFLMQHRPGIVDPNPWGYVRNIPSALLYVVNYVPDEPVSLSHLWSLSCEMQFYLLAPVIFLLGGKTTARRYGVWFSLLAVLMILGAVIPLSGPGLWARFKCHFEVSVWPMMLGFCCEYRKDWFRRVPARWYPYILGVTMVAFVVTGVLVLFGMNRRLPMVILGTFAFFPCFLNYLWGRPLPGPIGRIFSWLGERTYSIYLWQEPLTLCSYLAPAWHPVGALISVLVGGIWFRLFEQPFLSPNRKNFVESKSA